VWNLGLHGNQLTSLPPETGGLTALVRLDLTNNQLTSLPPELGRLTALRALYLHGNGELSIPASILGAVQSQPYYEDDDSSGLDTEEEQGECPP
jgi:Leucine-rich repeat (LRR) protein